MMKHSTSRTEPRGTRKGRVGRQLVLLVVVVLCSAYVGRAAFSGALSAIGLVLVTILICGTAYWRYQPSKGDATRLRQVLAERYFHTSGSEVVITMLGAEHHIPVPEADLVAPLPLEDRVGPYAALALHLRHESVPPSVQRRYDAYRSGYLEYLTIFIVVLAIWGAITNAPVWYLVACFAFCRFILIPLRVGDQVISEWRDIPVFDQSQDDLRIRTFEHEGRSIQYCAAFFMCVTIFYLNSIGYWSPLIAHLAWLT